MEQEYKNSIYIPVISSEMVNRGIGFVSVGNSTQIIHTVCQNKSGDDNSLLKFDNEGVLLPILLISTETVNQTKEFTCCCKKHTSNKNSRKQFMLQGFSSS